MINNISLRVIPLLLSTILYAQKAPKFGKVSEEELLLKECSFEPDANSMVLSNTGYLRFQYNDSKGGFQYRLEISKRIKVFNKLDKDIANVSIVIYDPERGSDKESVSNIKGFTYNLQDGKIVKTKLTNSEEYTTRISEYRSELSFAMPDVQDGSVIEYKYTLISDYISNLYNWHFQDHLPVAFSRFDCIIPEYFNYQNSQMGTYVTLDIDQEKVEESFIYSWESSGSLGKTEKGKSTMKSSSNRTIFTGRNIPAIQTEPYMNNRPDVPTRLEYQLMSIKLPYQAIKPIAGDYDQFNKTIMNWESFGKTLNKGNFSKDLLSTMNTTGLELAQNIYTHVQNHFTFDGSYGFTSSSAGRKAYNEGTGSVPQVNLTLIAMLREAGLKANPIILSTRGHGIPHPIYPNYEDFNYVIACVELDQGMALLDATSTQPFGSLPVRCLNGQGWLASENGGKWIDLKQKSRHSIADLAVINIDDEGIHSSHHMKFSGYAAVQEKKDFDPDQEEQYIESLAAQYNDAEIEEFSVDNNQSDFRISFNTNQEEDLGEVIYLQPIQSQMITSNPFKRETRQSLVDFPYLISKSMIVKITIPEGYTVELPEPTMLALPENGGRFSYNATQLGKAISIVSKFKLNQTTFTPDEYLGLKQFYDLVAKKNTEMIVLKAL